MVAPWSLRTKVVFIWYFCVGMTTGIRSQNTDMKSYSVYSASCPRPLPWYWSLLSVKANYKSRNTSSEMKFMRHKKCMLKDCRRNQDNLEVLRLNKHDQSSEVNWHMNLPHSEQQRTKSCQNNYVVQAEEPVTNTVLNFDEAVEQPVSEKPKMSPVPWHFDCYSFHH